MNKLTETAPERIFLQVSDEEGDDDCEFSDLQRDGAEVTWCDASMVCCEVKYVRSDLMQRAEAERDELRRELRAVLDDWNSIVAASGSKTNGGLAGHLTALRRDAERYRWLRGAAPAGSVRYSRWRLEYFDGPNGWNPLFREQLDAALDAGMGS